jgi:hypothetical protein
MKLLKLLMTAGLMVLFVSSIALSQTQGTAQKPESKDNTLQQQPDVQKPTRQLPTSSYSKPAANTVGKKDQAPNVPLTNARIDYDQTVFDFGVVPGGAQLTHHFPVRNIGTDTLVITQIKAG